MTRDGAVEENLTQGTRTKISARQQDAQLVPTAEADFNGKTVLDEKHKRQRIQPKKDLRLDGDHAEKTAAQTSDTGGNVLNAQTEPVPAYETAQPNADESPANEVDPQNESDFEDALLDEAAPQSIHTEEPTPQNQAKTAHHPTAHVHAQKQRKPVQQRTAEVQRQSAQGHSTTEEKPSDPTRQNATAPREEKAVPQTKTEPQTRTARETVSADSSGAESEKGRTAGSSRHTAETKTSPETESKAASGDVPSSDHPSSEKIKRLEQKSEKAHQRLDKARDKLPKQKVLKKERVFDEATGRGKTRLTFTEEVKPPRQKSKLIFEAEKPVRQAGLMIANQVHGKIHEAESENAAVEGAHKTEIAAENTVRHFSRAHQSRTNRPYERVSKLEHEADTADKKLNYEKTVKEHPEMQKQSHVERNRHYQKQSIKQDYAKARKSGSQTAERAKAAADSLREKAADKAKEFFAKNKTAFIWIGLGLLFIIFLCAGFSACSSIFSQGMSTVVSSTYLSKDEDMLGAEAAYLEMERNLQEKLDNYRAEHDYDEYRFALDEIGHDPYVLISILSALNGGDFTLADVQGTLQSLFDQQYKLTESVRTETRYRTETVTWYDSYGNPYTQTTQVPYPYTICTVTLENFDLSHLPAYLMDEDKLSLYATYMETLGNRPDLFPDSPYVRLYNKEEDEREQYEVEDVYLEDNTFAALIEEAEKYLGMPYVWGGSNPSTSFDCSGFVSYVLTNSGLVNTERLSAQGLYNICTPVSTENAQPGDLIFFKGTYDTPGVSHVGIYVGGGQMLHCGDPIQYTSIETNYWREHFFAYGRPPYKTP